MSDTDGTQSAQAAGSPQSTRAALNTSSLNSDPITVTVAGEHGKSLYEHIEDLKKEQQQARDDKKAVSRELRNAVRRKGRVMRKARELNNRDLAEVITMRQEVAKAKNIKLAQEEAEAGASSAASSGLPRAPVT